MPRALSVLQEELVLREFAHLELVLIRRSTVVTTPHRCRSPFADRVRLHSCSPTTAPPPRPPLPGSCLGPQCHRRPASTTPMERQWDRALQRQSAPKHESGAPSAPEHHCAGTSSIPDRAPPGVVRVGHLGEDPPQSITESVCLHGGTPIQHDTERQQNAGLPRHCSRWLEGALDAFGHGSGNPR